jgi:hypothetical protein
MKQLVFLFLIVLFALPFTTLAQTIDLQVNGVGTTAQYSVVLEKLGKPLSKKKGGVFPCDNGEMLTLRYQGLIVRLIEANDGTGFIVGSIDVTSPKWSVSNINVGASMKDVQAKFGQSDKTKKSGLENLSYGMAEGFANFYFRNNKLVKISWGFNIC